MMGTLTAVDSHADACDWDGMPDGDGGHEADVQVQEVGMVAIRRDCEWWPNRPPYCSVCLALVPWPSSLDAAGRCSECAP